MIVDVAFFERHVDFETSWIDDGPIQQQTIASHRSMLHTFERHVESDA
jgi:hypothetical protein